jgi:hypothetical protein
MTFDQRATAVQELGFTERQARFLVTVMLHSGVCMLRQYCAFAGIVCGQKARDFFKELIDRRFATAYRCAHGRARIFHLQNRPLYEAIGEGHSRFRKPTPVARAVERLMLLDAVLSSRDVTWLTTEREKLTHFTHLLSSRLSREELPHLRFVGRGSETVRYFPDKLQIAVPAGGSGHVFAYLVNRPSPVDFRQFLHRHAELLRALPKWTVRLLVPGHLAESGKAYERAWREEFASPVRLSTADELRWYFEERRRLETRQTNGNGHDEARFARARDAFGAPRYTVLYRSWLRNSSAVMKEVVSPVLADAIARRTGQLETRVLAHPYLHLAPLVTTA